MRTPVRARRRCRVALLILAAAALSPVATRAALTPATAELPRWSAIYAAAPSAGFGLTVGLADRVAARRSAERECRSRGAPCRLLAEFAERCGAVAQGVQRRATRGARPQESFVVTSTAAGAGRTQDEAEESALTACEAADRRGVCLIAASACGGAG